MKRLDSLIKFDLIKKPVWEHWYDQDIEYVKQSDLNELTETDNKGHIVLTGFLLNNGIQLIGFCSPQDTSGIDYIQQVIFSNKGQFNIYKDAGWTSEQKEEEMKKLDLDWKDIFPLVYKTQIRCDGAFYEGKILDFNDGE
jgi:hypothetical protein